MTKDEWEEINATFGEFFIEGNLEPETIKHADQECQKFQPDLFTRNDRYKKDINIIFLDIDGVLNYCLHAPSNSYNGRFRCGEEIEPKIIRKFNKIFKEYPDLKIVISSSWRSNMKKLIWALKISGFNYVENIIGYTQTVKAVHYINGDKDKPLEPPFTLRYEKRSQQILKWFLDNPGISYRLNKFLIIDDEVFDICGSSGFSFLKENTLQTNADTGLTNEDIKFIIEYFKGDENETN